MADTFKFVQNQPSTLAGAGTSIGDTSVILSSFTQIDGSLLTMTDFGSIGFGTIEPGNGIQEEQICWTGITQNTNGTATLTGVKSVLNVSPYTQTVGLLTSHAGGVQFVVSNTAGFYDKLAAKGDDETITGTYTFTNPNYPRMDTATPPPTDDEQLATKKYVDDTAFNGAPDASNTVKGIVQIPTQAQVDAKTQLGSTGAYLVVTPDLQRSTLLSDFALDTGGTNAYAIAVSPVITTYGTGQQFSFKATHTNSGASTININTLGTKSIVKLDGATALVSGDIASGQIINIEYDGSAFQMLNPSAKNFVDLTTSQNITSGTKVFTVLPQSSAVPGTGADLTNKTYVDATVLACKTGNTTHDMSSTTTTVITHGLGKNPKLTRMIVNKVQADSGTIVLSMPISIGSYDGSTQNSNFTAVSSNGATALSDQDTSNAIHYGFGNSAGANNDRLVGSVSTTSTNITITWSKTGSSTGTGNIIWEVIG